MKLFRNLMFAVIASVALLGSSGVISNSSAQAHETGHYRYYYIYYRSCPCSPWTYYGAYTCPTQAQYAASYVQSFGYEVYIY